MAEDADAAGSTSFEEEAKVVVPCRRCPWLGRPTSRHPKCLAPEDAIEVTLRAPDVLDALDDGGDIDGGDNKKPGTLGSHTLAP